MNVLFITHYSSLYGANRSLLGLLDGIDTSKIKPYVILPTNGDLVDELEKRNISYYIFPFKDWMATTRSKSLFRLAMNLISLPALLWKVKRWNIDLIHTNSSVTPIGAWLAFITGLPHIWHIREFGWEDYDLKYDFGRKVFEYWLNKANQIISVSEAIKKKVLNGIKSPNSVIYNGVISRKVAEKLSKNVSNTTDKTIFGIIGLLTASKGQDQAVQAFERINKLYSETELWIAGSGNKEFESYLQKLVIDLDISDRVKFLGYVDDPFKFFEQIEVALICSKNEGMGRVTAEAMIAGKVIIGLDDNAGTSELVEDRKTGLLYDGTLDSLVEKMTYTLNNDVSKYAMAARKVGLEKFLTDKYANRVEQIYNEILKEE